VVAPSQAKRLAHLLTYTDLASLPKPAWLIDKYFPSKGVAWLIGKTGVYKTYLAASIACSVAYTNDWAGLRTKHGRVIYIAAEDIEGAAPKFRAWGKHHNVVENAMGNLLVYEQALNLGDTDKVKLFINDLKAQYDANDFRLFVIDTLAQCSPGINENSKHEMDVIVQNLDLLWKTFNCLVLVIHHMGATTERIRGSTVMDGYSYGTLKAEVVDERVSLSDGKRRYGATQPALYLDRVDVPMGYPGDDGQEVVEIVLTRAQNQIQHMPGVLTQRQKEALAFIYGAQDHSMQQSNLMTLMHVGKSNMTYIIKPMVDSGFLGSTKVGRSTTLTVTDRGKLLLADQGYIENPTEAFDLYTLSKELGLSNNGSSP
jgi:DNA-binding MarR family transcriptional regulator